MALCSDIPSDLLLARPCRVELRSSLAGLESVMPLNTKLVMNYGPIACPVLGVAAAIAVLLTDLYCRRTWIQPTLVLVLIALGIYTFHSLLFSYFGPSPRPIKKAIAVDSGIALLQSARPVDAVAER